MKEVNDQELRKLLQGALAADADLKQDLWPRMLRRLDEQPVRVLWLDWVLAALLAAWCLAFPGVIPALAYQL